MAKYTFKTDKKRQYHRDSRMSKAEIMMIMILFHSSGYRCPQLNAAVGGVKNSNHLTGCAADLHLPNNEVGREWFRWLMDNTHFDELIWETSDRKRYWIHIALRPSGNRQRVVSFLLKK